MKVCLRRGYHHVFDDLVRHPPRGVEYVIQKVVSSGGQAGIKNVLKRKAWRLYSNLMNSPNAISIRAEPGTDLIHSNSGFMVKNEMPWVVDIEHVSTFVGYEAGRLEKARGKIEALLSSRWCKKIMPWTKAGEKSILNGLDTWGFRDKIEVVYPAISPTKIKEKKHDGINVLFVSYGFYNKAGKEVLEACRKLRKSQDFNLTMISDAPAEMRRKYPEFEYIEPKLDRESLLRDYFAKADIFLLPSYMDTFGLVYLEAMSMGIPIIASNVFALPEIVGKAGMLVDIGKYSWFGKDNLFAYKSWSEMERKLVMDEKPQITLQIERSLARLMDSRHLRERLGKAGRKEILKGKFSINNRNEKLRRIYEEALRR